MDFPFNHSSYVFCDFSFEGKHCWPDAVNHEGVEFLSLKHRHIFHVRVIVSVSHDDRDVEFILMKRYLEKYTRDLPLDLHNSSCEMLAYCIGIATHCFVQGLSHERMYFEFPFLRSPWNIDYNKKTPYKSDSRIQVKVSEDNENGSIVIIEQSNLGLNK